VRPSKSWPCSTNPITPELTARFRHKRPWDGPAPAGVLSRLRKHIGPPPDEREVADLLVGTEVALRLAESAGGQLDLLEAAAALLRERGRSAGASELGARLADALGRLVNLCPSAFDRARRTPEAPAGIPPGEPAWVLGHRLGSAHAAAVRAPWLVAEVWNLCREMAADRVGEHDLGRHTLLLFDQARAQFPTDDFSDLLDRICVEHLAARARRTGGGTSDGSAVSQAAAPTPEWSRSHTRAQLADFFAETLKTLDSYFARAGVRCQEVTRQRFMIDLSFLPRRLRADFVARLEAATAAPSSPRSRAAPPSVRPASVRSCAPGGAGVQNTRLTPGAGN
jgi:hypothetical protein